MKVIFILGKIGSGKTTFLKKLQKINFLCFKKPLIFIEIDKIVKKIYENKFYEKELILLSKQYGIKINNTNKYKLLFHSTPTIKKKSWKTITKFFDPIITSYIKKNILENNKKKGTIIFDLALPNLIQKTLNNIFSNKIYILPSKKLYPSIFLLKKYRKLSYKHSLFFLNLQNTIYKKYKKY